MKSSNASSIKALRLLDLFTAGAPSLALEQIAALSGLPRSTAFRMVNALVTAGFLEAVAERGSPKRYRLGLRLLELGEIVAEQLEIRRVALPFMVDLRDKVEEAVQLLVMDHGEAMYVEKVETTRPVRLYTRVGRRAAVYAGACPRALIAFLPEEELTRVLDEQTFRKYTPFTVDDRKQLERQIRVERAQGYTISCGELHEGTVAIAMPVRNHTGKVVASVSIAGEQSRFSAQRQPELVKALRACVEGISSSLGWRPDAGSGPVRCLPAARV